MNSTAVWLMYYQKPRKFNHLGEFPPRTLNYAHKLKISVIVSKTNRTSETEDFFKICR